jgi:membrane-associated protease RseP (regulator of RpoE activity)
VDALLFILGIVIIAAGVIVSIGLHEVGHLVPAKLFGVRVSQYMVGFGKTLFSVRKGETEYGLKAFPLGGYISMNGMFPPAKDPAVDGRVRAGFFRGMVQDARSSSAESILPGEEARAFYNLPIWKRIIIMIGGPFMNLVIGVVLFGVLLCGIGLPNQTVENRVESVAACVTNATSASQTCAPGAPASPAKAAGLRAGDVFVSIGGKPVTTWQQTSAAFQASPGKTIAVVVRRDGRDVTLRVTPALATEYVTDSKGDIVTNSAGDKETHKVGYVGVYATPAVTMVRQPPTAVLPAVGAQLGAVFGVMVHLPQEMVQVWNAAFGSAQRPANGPMGLVGIGRAAGDVTATAGVPLIGKVYELLAIIASLNFSLFVFNLIPLLPLDGGHIAGALWEGIKKAYARVFRRRAPGPVDIARLMPVTFVVVVLLIGMSLLLTYADIVKPVSLG